MLDWLVFEVFGVFVGGFLSGALAHRLKLTVEKGPRISTRGRLIFAFIGGVLMIVGAKIATGLHQRTGPDRRRPAQRRQLDVHVVRLRGRLCPGLLLQKAVDLT